MRAEAHYGFVLLAGGSSSRLGRPKALLPYRDASLIRHIAGEMAALALPVMVVTGAQKEALEQELFGMDCRFAHNDRWREGMAASIRAGLAALLALELALDGVIFANCDQPFISAGLFRSLITRHEETEKQIIAGAYDSTFGTPALFGKPYFNALSALTGRGGAKALMRRHAQDLATVPFPDGGIDIDTEADYARLLQITSYL